MDIDRVQAEMQAKVDAEKENEDVAMRKIRAQVARHIQLQWQALVPSIPRNFEAY